MNLQEDTNSGNKHVAGAKLYCYHNLKNSINAIRYNQRDIQTIIASRDLPLLQSTIETRRNAKIEITNNEKYESTIISNFHPQMTYRLF